jgi:hypothetical protein
MIRVCPSFRRGGSFPSNSSRCTRGSRPFYRVSEGGKENVFIQSSTGNLFQRVSNLFHRIFKAEAYITTNWRDTGLIGADQAYRFSENLKTPDKKPISVPSNAFYVPIKTRSVNTNVAVSDSYYMPSILFEGARENDVISYYLRNRKIELTLKQQLHPHENGRQNFESFFASLKHYFLSNLQKPRDPIFLFSQDIPPGTPCLGFRALDAASATIYTAGTNRWELFSTNLSNVELFNDSLKNSGQFQVLETSTHSASSTFLLGATGMKKENFKILVDKNYLVLIGERTSDLNGEAIEGFNRIPTQLSLQLTDDRLIDPRNTVLRIYPNGIAQLTVAFKSGEAG